MYWPVVKMKFFYLDKNIMLWTVCYKLVFSNKRDENSLWSRNGTRGNPAWNWKWNVGFGKEIQNIQLLWWYIVIVKAFCGIYCIYSLWPNDAIWRHKSRSTLAQVKACCLTAPSHYLNQCWLIFSEVQWHSVEGSLRRDSSPFNH